MNCTDFLKQLTDYFDGRVEPALMKEVQAHLAEMSGLTADAQEAGHAQA